MFFRYDQTIHNLDVLVDFISERKEVREAQGPNYPFSFGDYVVKSLIGSIDPQLGNLDEKKDKKMTCAIKDCCLIL